MDAWRRRVTRRLLGLVLAFHVPFVALAGSLLHDAAHLGYGLATLVALLALVAVNAPLVHRLRNWSTHERVSPLGVWLVETPYFVHFVACLPFGPLGALTLLAYVATALSRAAPLAPLYAWLGPLYVASALLGAYATLVRRFWTVTRTIELAIPGLPDALEGYTLVQLSDIHCGPYLPRWFYRGLARRASALGAHAIVVTGDLVANGDAYLPDVTDFARGLAAPDGVFAGLGNHDYYGTGASGVADALAAGGARVLRNEGTALAGGALYLAAIDDTWSGRGDLARAMAGRPAGSGACVLLAHDPAEFTRIVADHGDAVDLVLSGHTHGGQLAVPFASTRWNLARVREQYTAGLYREGRTALFVHRGNGTSGPPARIGSAPEIARIVLRRG